MWAVMNSALTCLVRELKCLSLRVADNRELPKQALIYGRASKFLRMQSAKLPNCLNLAVSVCRVPRLNANDNRNSSNVMKLNKPSVNAATDICLLAAFAALAVLITCCLSHCVSAK